MASGITYKLVFSGELAEGIAREDAKAAAAKLFKFSDGQIAQMFSGRAVTLKRGLPASGLERYCNTLRQVGLVVQVEVEQTAGLPLATDERRRWESLSLQPIEAPVDESEVQRVASLEDPIADEVVCPKCSLRQLGRTLCRDCGADMPAMRRAAEESPPPQRTRVQSLEEYVSELGPDVWTPPIFSLGVKGRISSTQHMIWTVLLAMIGLPLLVLCWASVPFAHSNAVPLFGITAAVVVYRVRLKVLRLHDLGVTGWLALIDLIPYLTLAYTPLLMLWPGKGEENRYGHPPGSAMEGLSLRVVAVMAMVDAVLLGHLARVVTKQPDVFGVLFAFI